MKILLRRSVFPGVLGILVGVAACTILYARTGRLASDRKPAGYVAKHGLVAAAEFQALNGPPVGAVIAFVGPWDERREKQTGWMRCNGRTLKATDFPELAELLSVSQVGQIKLPDLSGRAIIGTGTGEGLTKRDLFSLGGAETHKLTVDEMPSHGHAVTDPGHKHSFKFGHAFLRPMDNGFPTARFDKGFEDSAETEQAKTSISIQASGGDKPCAIMPPFLALHYIIKVSSAPIGD
jgi:microcystin-dependent protein